MNKIDKAIEELLSEDEEITLARGFEDAFTGIGRRFGLGAFAVYDLKKCLELLVKDGMSEEEAIEYFEFNVLGAYVGDSTPVFLEYPSQT